MASSFPLSIAGIEIPDTPLVRAPTTFIRDAEDDLLFDHSRRVFLFGALHGHRRGLTPNLELLYVGAMFHDLGLTDRYRNSSTLRFEVDGTNAARDFLLQHGVDDADTRKVWLGIALHTTPRECRSSSTRKPLGHPGSGNRRAGHRTRRPVRRCAGRCHRRAPSPATSSAASCAPSLTASDTVPRPRSEPSTPTSSRTHDSSFARDDFVDIILSNTWPE